MKVGKYYSGFNKMFRVFARQIRAYDGQPTIRYSAIIRSFLEHQKAREGDLYTGTSIRSITDHMRKFDKFTDADYVKSELEVMPFAEVVAIDSYVSGQNIIRMDKWSIVELNWYAQRRKDMRVLRQIAEREDWEEE